ncbi:hypothetical protein GWK47_037092 [Chionoecetes opilio]|uniref:Uncharacterized protein n=1 Tax=Chionoecetes opilio TaxID=41210 RepID=A0A8J5CMS0_CHIOP|nr:hypothetical protein GWK47_037092 [Chionoecetes opilio]
MRHSVDGAYSPVPTPGLDAHNINPSFTSRNQTQPELHSAHTAQKSLSSTSSQHAQIGGCQCVGVGGGDGGGGILQTLLQKPLRTTGGPVLLRRWIRRGGIRGLVNSTAEGVLIAQSALDRVHSVNHLQSCAPMTASVLAVPISVVLTPASNTTLVCLRTDAQHLNPALHASPS